MLIDTIKFIAVTSGQSAAGSRMFVGLTVTVDGEVVATSEDAGGGAPGAVKETEMALSHPIESNSINLASFDLYVEAGGDPTDAWLPAEIYVLGRSGSGDYSLLAGISNWPDSLWMSRDPAGHSGPEALSNYNLGVVAGV